MSEFDLRSLVAELHERGVRFVIIGGVAVAAHGYVRTTADLDIVPEPSPDNLERLSKTLSALESTLPTAGNRTYNAAKDAKVMFMGGNVTADTKLGSLDIVRKGEGLPEYRELESDAVETDVLGVPAKVCSLRRLREMKGAQGRPQDHADLEALPRE